MSDNNFRPRATLVTLGLVLGLVLALVLGFVSVQIAPLYDIEHLGGGAINIEDPAVDPLATVQADVNLIQTPVAKIDDAASDGLSGTADSLAYRINEVDRHNHSYERWFGVAAAPSGTTDCGDSISGGASAYQADAGNDTWGDWLCVLGSSDTPAIAGSDYFDLHRITVVGVERNGATHFVQIGCGATYTAVLSGGTYSEAVFEPPTAASGNELPIVIQQRRQEDTTLCWLRVYIPGQNTGTLDFFAGLHEYEG